MEVANKDVMILKAPVEDADEGQHDPYSCLLQKNGFTVTNIPVIDFEYCNLGELQDCLQAPEKFSGIIFTSPRSVHATALSLGADQHVIAQWRQHSFFVVGKTTADTLRGSLGVDGEGAESGSALKLADYITHRCYARPLLYPCSSLQQGTLSSKLQEKGVEIHAVTSYRTVVHPLMEQRVRQVLAATRIPQFLVYFSPSGVAFSLPVLRALQLPLHQLKIIAIGTTTKAALEKSDLCVWSVCKEPTPDHLLHELLAPSTP